MESFCNVLKRIRKPCTNTGRSLKGVYTVEKIGPQTGLATVHTIEGTGKNESTHK